MGFIQQRSLVLFFVGVFSFATSLWGQGFVDDFENGVVDLQWSVSSSFGGVITFAETGGAFHVTEVHYSQGQNANLTLYRPFPALTGVFELRIPLSWQADTLAGLASTNECTIYLKDASGRTKAKCFFNDNSDLLPPTIKGKGPVLSSPVSTLPLAGSGEIRIRRDLSDNLDFFLFGPDLQVQAFLGIVHDDITQISIVFKHTGTGVPPFTAISMESISLTPSLAPMLTLHNLQGGSTALLTMDSVTPGQAVLWGLSLTGAGPTLSQYGTLALSPPILPLPPTVPGVTGEAVLAIPIPPQSAGRTLWVHGFDPASGGFSNSLALVVQ